jgi:hypothetical protein
MRRAQWIAKQFAFARAPFYGMISDEQVRSSKIQRITTTGSTGRKSVRDFLAPPSM